MISVISMLIFALCKEWGLVGVSGAAGTGRKRCTGFLWIASTHSHFGGHVFRLKLGGSLSQLLNDDWACLTFLGTVIPVDTTHEGLCDDLQDS